MQARTFGAADEKSDAVLQFAGKLLSEPASLSTEDLRLLRQQGLTDGEVLEVIANVVRNIFTNYVNVIAGTAVDWPLVVHPLNTAADAAR